MTQTFYLKKVKVSEILELLKENDFSIEFRKNKIKIVNTKKRDILLEDSINNLIGLNFRVIKNKNGVRIVFMLRDKMDANICNNKVMKDSELYPFINIIPREYNLYVENYQAEMND
jgi:hypothetical protein